MSSPSAGVRLPAAPPPSSEMYQLLSTHDSSDIEVPDFVYRATPLLVPSS